MTAEHEPSAQKGESPLSPWDVALAEFNRVRQQPYDGLVLEGVFGQANSALSDRTDLGLERFELGHRLAQEAAGFAEANGDSDSGQAYAQIAAAYHELQHEYGEYDH